MRQDVIGFLPLPHSSSVAVGDGAGWPRSFPALSIAEFENGLASIIMVLSRHGSSEYRFFMNESRW